MKLWQNLCGWFFKHPRTQHDVGPFDSSGEAADNYEVEFTQLTV